MNHLQVAKGKAQIKLCDLGGYVLNDTKSFDVNSWVMFKISGV